MSYGIKVRGVLGIEPPLSAAELREHPEFLHDEMSREQECYVDVDRFVQFTDVGENVAMAGARIAVTSPDESFSRSRLNDQIQAIVTAYSEHHLFPGFLELTGQDGDLSR